MSKSTKTPHGELFWRSGQNLHKVEPPTKKARLSREAASLVAKAEPSSKKEMETAVEALKPFDKHYLFYIHGFNNTPADVFKSCATYHTAHSDRIVIPVIWANEGDIMGYPEDKGKNAKEAAYAFAPLVGISNAFPQRSLVCHSMGNYVLQLTARKLADTEGLSFQNVFMVAADVDERLFDKKKNENDDIKRNDGLSILKLVTDEKKVHVMYSTIDKALKARKWANLGEEALGLKGYDHAEVLPAMLAKLVLIKCDDWNVTDTKNHHGYFFEKEMMEYYESKLDGN
jgi:esterase/lipase superfamily enzyme